MPTITRLPLDLEGTKPSNWRANEIHTVVTATGKKNRIIVPDFGAFFIDNAVVRDSKGVALVRHKNLEFTYHYELFSELTGKGVCAMIVITDPTLVGPFRVSYQAVGGNFSLSVKELGDVINAVTNTVTKIKWDDILDKPTAYQPADHVNKWWQIMGLDSLVTNLNRVADSWAVGRKVIIDANRGYYDNYIADMQAAVDSYRARIYAHIDDKTNPHKTDKTKIGLGNVQNWSLANKVESESTSISNKYQPIGGVYNQLAVTAIPILDTHIKNKATTTKADPHNVTIAQLGLYSKTEVNNIFSGKLAKNQIASDTTLLNGLSYQQVYNNCRVNFSQNNFVLGSKWPMNKMAPWAGGDGTDYLYQGDGNFVHISTLMQTFNNSQGSIYYGGLTAGRTQAEATAFAKSVGAGIPEGAWLIIEWTKWRHDIPGYEPAIYQKEGGQIVERLIGGTISD